jgi:hypothetical protein
MAAEKRRRVLDDPAQLTRTVSRFAREPPLFRDPIF